MLKRASILCFTVFLTTLVYATENNAKEHSSTYACVKEAGFNPDSFIFVYTKGHGAKWNEMAKNAARRTGIRLTEVDLGLPIDGKDELMKCFIANYSLQDREYSTIPHLLCPKDGMVRQVYQDTPVSNQMHFFAENCRDIGRIEVILIDQTI